MDPISLEALTTLTARLSSLLPAADPAVAPTLLMKAVRFLPTGVGAFVATNENPVGDILGRRVAASAQVTVQGNTDQALHDAVTAVTDALVGADRATLSGQGLFRLSLAGIGEKTPVGAGGVVQRDLMFDILYEFLKGPTDAEGVIERVPIDLEVDLTGSARTLVDSLLGAASLANFDVVDDPQATTGGPSQWAANGAQGRIEQTARIRGGPQTPTPEKPGTYLMLKPTTAVPPVSDFLLRSTLRSDDTGGVGLVFRFQDVDNFYFFLMDSQSTFRLLGKKIAGSFHSLDTPALDTATGYETGRLYEVKLSAQGTTIEFSLDGTRILGGRDASLTAPGRVGFLSRNNNASFFYRISLVQT